MGDPAFDRLLALLGAVLERSCRYGALEEFCEKEGEERVARLAQWLLDEKRRGREGVEETLALLAELAVRLPADRKALLSAAAAAAGLPEAARFFAAPPAGEEEGLPRGDVLKGKDGKPLTLGERKSLARNPRRQLLARLLFDPSPDVVRNLLASPKMTEGDVVRIAASRAAPATVLREIFLAPRWLPSARVRAALAGNPSLPPELALKIVPLLRRQDLRELAEGAPSDEEVRRLVAAMLASRREEGPARDGAGGSDAGAPEDDGEVLFSLPGADEPGPGAGSSGDDG